MAAFPAQIVAPVRAPSSPVSGALPSLPVGDEGRPSLSWLVQLHWWAILGQLIVIGVAEK